MNEITSVSEVTSVFETSPITTVFPETEVIHQEGCTKCGSSQNDNFVYAIGKIKLDFPSESLQMEYQNAAGKLSEVIFGDSLEYAVLSQGNNLNIARELNWILQTDDGVESYILQPRTYVELSELIDYLNPVYGGRSDMYVAVIGLRGSISLPSEYNGIQLPILLCNNIYTFSKDIFAKNVVNSIKEPQDDAQTLSKMADCVKLMFDTMLQFTDNAGNTDAHRAINYLSIKYDGIYKKAWDTITSNNSNTLSEVMVNPVKVLGNRKLVDVIVSFNNLRTDEKDNWFCRVDVTGQYPFLVKKLSKYYPAP